MQILFDQGTPVPLRALLPGHEIKTAFELSWSTLKNGALLTAAEGRRFAVLVTTDRNLKYQQNFSTRHIAIIVLSTTNWPRIRASVAKVGAALDAIKPGEYVEVNIP